MLGQAPDGEVRTTRRVRWLMTLTVDDPELGT